MTTAKPQLSLYNTLTRSKAPFVPEDANNVRLYACGPTVYDFAHIGNGRAAIVFDLLFRVLKHLYPGDGSAFDGSRVTYVRNITDVDDKINARALRDHPDLPLNDAIRKVTETTARQYQKDTAALGCLEPTVQPRATENIAEMQAMIQRLLDKGNAYEAGGEVLFAVDSMPDYGKLSGRNLEDNLAGARVAVDTHKRNPADFVLWKLSSNDEPGWESPWGRGRPGWHIECSAMSERYLGETFDIHGGGLDLIFPHHENEIAQSRCAHGSHAMANVWMHNGFLQVEGQQMSKSLGNFFTIHQLLETEDFGGRKWPGEVLRLAMLMTHYREPIDFTVKRLEEAEKKLLTWKKFAAGRAARAPSGSVVDQFFRLLADDLNTLNAFAYLDDVVSGHDERRGHRAAVYKIIKLLGFTGLKTEAEKGAKSVMQALSVLESMEPHHWSEYFYTASNAPRFSSGRIKPETRLIVALNKIVDDFKQRKPSGLSVPLDVVSEVFANRGVASSIERLAHDGIRRRLAALNAKDFAEADRIRNELADQGIALMDYKDENGQRQTKWEVKR